MSELVYPDEVAPVVPPFSMATKDEHTGKKEWFPVVEPSGLVTGREVGFRFMKLTKLLRVLLRQ